jgi:hypothetical protein
VHTGAQATGAEGLSVHPLLHIGAKQKKRTT